MLHPAHFFCGVKPTALLHVSSLAESCVVFCLLLPPLPLLLLLFARFACPCSAERETGNACAQLREDISTDITFNVEDDLEMLHEDFLDMEQLEFPDEEAQRGLVCPLLFFVLSKRRRDSFESVGE